MEYHKDHPVANTVEVINGQSFSDVLLRPRIDGLLKAQTVQDLLSAADPVQQSLRLFATDPKFTLDIDSKPPGPLKDGVLYTKTTVDLSSSFPSAQLAVSAQTYDRDHAALNANYTYFNHLGLAETLNLSAAVRPQPYGLGAGAAELRLPAPSGTGHIRTAGFFYNHDRPWMSYALASHGLAATVGFPLNASYTMLSEFGVEAVARHVHSIKDSASDAVRAAAGGASSTLKVAATASFNAPGLSVVGEIAGKPGDAHHVKVEAACSRTVDIASALSADFGGAFGYLHSRGSASKISDILDRFILGGANSMADPKRIIGAKRGGLGPAEDGETGSSDHLGVQSYLIGRAALHSKVPFTSSRFPQSPLRLTALINASAGQLNSKSLVASNIRDLLTLKPFVAAAGGLTYSTGPAKMELLYVVPLQLSGPSDLSRAGLQVGVELNLA